MNLSQPGATQSAIRIPKQLYCSETGKPFSHCLVCNKYLLHDGISYMVEKSFRQIPEMNLRESIFEYALCHSCSAMMNASLSTESRERIDAYFQENTDLYGRSKKLLSAKTLRLKPWVEKCIVKGTPILKSREYQLVAECNGKNLIFTVMPFAISLEAIDEITGLLSDKSLGEIDNFMGKYFTGPPEVSEILKRRLVII